jgi:hypothetical protein
MSHERDSLSRNEHALLNFFRKLTVEQQLEFLDEVEESCNLSARMQELSKRNQERGSFRQFPGHN